MCSCPCGATCYMPAGLGLFGLGGHQYHAAVPFPCQCAGLGGHQRAALPAPQHHAPLPAQPNPSGPGTASSLQLTRLLGAATFPAAPLSGAGMPPGPTLLGQPSAAVLPQPTVFTALAALPGSGNVPFAARPKLTRKPSARAAPAQAGVPTAPATGVPLGTLGAAVPFELVEAAGKLYTAQQAVTPAGLIAQLRGSARGQQFVVDSKLLVAAGHGSPKPHPKLVALTGVLTQAAHAMDGPPAQAFLDLLMRRRGAAAAAAAAATAPEGESANDENVTDALMDG